MRVKRVSRIHHRSILTSNKIPQKSQKKKTFRVGGPQLSFSISSSFIFFFVLLPFYFKKKNYRCILISTGSSTKTREDSCWPVSPSPSSSPTHSFWWAWPLRKEALFALSLPSLFISLSFRHSAGCLSRLSSCFLPSTKTGLWPRKTPNCPGWRHLRVVSSRALNFLSLFLVVEKPKYSFCWNRRRNPDSFHFKLHFLKEQQPQFFLLKLTPVMMQSCENITACLNTTVLQKRIVHFGKYWSSRQQREKEINTKNYWK